eukprot:gene51873-biopygen113383
MVPISPPRTGGAHSECNSRGVPLRPYELSAAQHCGQRPVAWRPSYLRPRGRYVYSGMAAPRRDAVPPRRVTCITPHAPHTTTRPVGEVLRGRLQQYRNPKKAPPAERRASNDEYVMSDTVMLDEAPSIPFPRPTAALRGYTSRDLCDIAAVGGAPAADAAAELTSRLRRGYSRSSNPDRGERAPLRDVGPGVRTHGPRAPVFTVAPAPTRTPIHVGTVLCAAAAAGGALHGAVAQTHDPGSVNQHDPATEERLDAWVNAKRAKDYATADAIRAELQAHGVDAEAARPAVWAAAELCRAAAPGVAADAARSDDA